MAQSPSNNIEFRRIFDDHFVEVQRYCARRLGQEEANDAVSEVFLVAWRRLGEVPRGDAALPWLIGVARNAVRNAGRSRRRAGRLAVRAQLADDQVTPGPEVQVVQKAEYREVADALESLSDADREVIRLRTWEELTAPQIASVLGISLSAAEKRMARSMARLERAIERRRTSTRPRAIRKGGDA
ncbi:MAG: sigma-70 family RNA polymerase sigma factor [Acidimicrobiia bacterium]|nr:sigma-70 family RNA polymerase sigma factor [Acidimicrobiia bacterium]MBT8194114.1 sigma-70 family RNA polymerase sigma factor [Acidimicrobiia bacterium]NNF88317.1 sigma-70 family RNA polymerase sigma factor [Acidimicrobiia bacterium]NNL14843.1 sigma-70 family RNA polymerase sigma factor [Acidimicrobiia bacterium]NNL98745.1 sigma-70 family RNA polymerase sigma factor [Acidimicrobiia bacterium]